MSKRFSQNGAFFEKPRDPIFVAEVGFRGGADAFRDVLDRERRALGQPQDASVNGPAEDTRKFGQQFRAKLVIDCLRLAVEGRMRMWRQRH